MICLYCARWKLDWICSWLICVAGLLVEGWKEEEERDKEMRRQQRMLGGGAKLQNEES